MGSRGEQLFRFGVSWCHMHVDKMTQHVLPVILFAEPPLQAEIMMRSSMMVSLIFELPDCTMKTSFSLTLVKIRTLVSPCILAIGQRLQ